MARDRIRALEHTLEAAVAAALPVPTETQIRLTEPSDAAGIRSLLESSFPTPAEAELVERLAADGAIVMSLVAVEDASVVGYVGFSRLLVQGESGEFAAVALGPLAVDSLRRNLGIGSRLVREGHACLAATGESLSVVLGEPSFYTKLGYSRQRAEGFASEYPAEYLLATSFAEAPRYGKLVYAQAFSSL